MERIGIKYNVLQGIQVNSDEELVAYLAGKEIFMRMLKRKELYYEIHKDISSLHDVTAIVTIPDNPLTKYINADIIETELPTNHIDSGHGNITDGKTFKYELPKTFKDLKGER